LDFENNPTAVTVAFALPCLPVFAFEISTTLHGSPSIITKLPTFRFPTDSYVYSYLINLDFENIYIGTLNRFLYYLCATTFTTINLL